MTYALVIVLGSGAFVLAQYQGERALQDCVATAQRITERDAREQREHGHRGMLVVEANRTFPQFWRAHCERVSP